MDSKTAETGVALPLLRKSEGSVPGSCGGQHGYYLRISMQNMKKVANQRQNARKPR
jgi:hypothetical protein